MTSLQELNFHGALAGDEVLAAIAAIPRLHALHCQDPVSGDAGFVALSQCATLERLAARVCRQMTAVGFAAIAGLRRLRSLSLGGPRIADAAMAHLAAAPALTDLNPIMFGDAAFEHIAKIPRLERLTNMYNRSTGDAATRFLREHPSLETTAPSCKSPTSLRHRRRSSLASTPSRLRTATSSRTRACASWPRRRGFGGCRTAPVSA
jgi:hypothetical protein